MKFLRLASSRRPQTCSRVDAVQSALVVQHSALPLHGYRGDAGRCLRAGAVGGYLVMLGAAGRHKVSGIAGSRCSCKARLQNAARDSAE